MEPKDLTNVKGNPLDLNPGNDTLSKVALDLHTTTYWDSESSQIKVYDNTRKIWKTGSLSYLYEIAAEKRAIIDKTPFEAIKPLSKGDKDRILLLLGIAQRARGDNNFEDLPEEITTLLGDNPKLIPYKDKIFNLTNRQYYEHSPKFKIQSVVTHNAPKISGEKPTTFLKLLSNLSSGNQKVIDGLLALTFLAMTGRDTLERSIFHLYSEQGGAGKGTFINILQEIVGDRSIVLTLNGLKDDSTLASAEGKSLWLFPEERAPLSRSGKETTRLLSASSRDLLSGRIVYTPQPFSYRSEAIIVINSNNFIFPNDGGFNRRVIVIKAQVPSSEDYIPNVANKLRKEIPTIIGYVLNYFDCNIDSAISTVESLSEESTIVSNLRESHSENDLVSKFIDAFVKFRKVSNRKDTPISQIWWMASIYRCFKSWAIHNYGDMKIPNKTDFETRFKLMYHEEIGAPLHYDTFTRNDLSGQRKRVTGVELHLDNMDQAFSSLLEH